MTLLIPVTRPWTMRSVTDAIQASDIPHERCILILNAPGCELWGAVMESIGFDVEIHATGNPAPPKGRKERHAGHRAMVKLSQTLVPDGALLIIEDDILVAPDIWARLSAIGPHATGVQISRHTPRPVVYGKRDMGTGVEDIEACGYGCLLTTGEAYKAAKLADAGPCCDREHTAQLKPLRIDWGCVCGHMTENGVLWPEQNVMRRKGWRVR